MAKMLFDTEPIKATADKIRERAYTENEYSTEEMPAGVEAVYQSGFTDGENSVPSIFGSEIVRVEPMKGYGIGPCVKMSYIPSEPIALKPKYGSNLELCAPFSDFGNAQTDDVTEGKTFTAQGGLLAVGTGKRPSKIAYWDEMLGDFYTEVLGGYGENPEDEYNLFYMPTSCLCTVGNLGDDGYWTDEYHFIIPQGTQALGNENLTRIVIPRSIVNIEENAFDYAYDPYNQLGITVVVCLAPNPPTMGWQGAWSADGGMCPPYAIYVPDESVDAYKAETTWAEYADVIRPISEFE